MSMPPPPPPAGSSGSWPSNVREHPDGTTVLVLGILGLVLCGLLAPVAWVKGNNVRREMQSQPGVTWSNAGTVNAGRILGIVGTVLILTSIVFVVLVLVVVVGANAR